MQQDNETKPAAITATMSPGNTNTPRSIDPIYDQNYHIIRARAILLAIGLLIIILAAGALICYVTVFRDPEPGLRDAEARTTATDNEEQEGYESYEDEPEVEVNDVVRREAVMKKIADEEEAERNYAKREAMESDALMEGFDSNSHLG